MKIKSLDPVIATRRLSGQSAHGVLDITVKIGLPRPLPNSSDYYCPYQFIGIEDDTIRDAAGIDSVQAIQLAMRMIGMFLYIHLNPQVGNSLRWSGNKDGDLGFPKPEESLIS